MSFFLVKNIQRPMNMEIITTVSIIAGSGLVPTGTACPGIVTVPPP